MVSKNSNSASLFENLQDLGEKIGASGDVYKTTVKITTFTSKDDKLIQHSYEETHKGNKLTSMKTSFDNSEHINSKQVNLNTDISSIINSLRGDDDSFSQSSDEEIKRNRIHEFLQKCKKKVKVGSEKECAEKKEKIKNEMPSLLISREESSSLGYSTENSENKEKSIKHTEDNLKKELEAILLQVYLDHLNNSQEIDVKIYEKHIDFCTDSFNSRFNLYILQILGDKISLLVEYIKDRIYKKTEVNILREKFYELKSGKEARMKAEQNFNKNKDVNTNNVTKSKPEGVELNDKIRKVIKEMLLDLRDNIYAVLDAANDIRRIFSPILQHFCEKKPDFLNFEDMHKEEFAKWVYKDEFLKIIFLQIKVNAKNSSYEELNDILCEIEEILRSHNKEMTRFKFFVEMALEKCEMEDYEPKQKTINFTQSNTNFQVTQTKSSTKKKNLHHYTCKNCLNKMKCCESSEVANQDNPNNFSPTNKDKYQNIDDLLDYINSNGEGNSKTKKKKHKNNKKKCTNSTNNANNNINACDKEKIEQEIEDFKLNLKTNSVNAFEIRKIRPIFSNKWLSNIDIVGHPI